MLMDQKKRASVFVAGPLFTRFFDQNGLMLRSFVTLTFFFILRFVMGRMGLLFGRVATHELEEATLPTTRCLVLVEES